MADSNTQVSKEALKPCPFCGKQPFPPVDTSYGYWAISCRDENECAVQPQATGDTEAEAITAWNTRSDQSALAEREACAKVADDHRAPQGVPQSDYDMACTDIATAIRERKV